MLRDHAATVRRLYAAFVAGDRRTVDAILTDDFRFTSQYDDAIDKAAFFERCFPNGSRFTEHAIEQLVVRGDTAFARYRAATIGGEPFRNVEYFTFAGDQVRSVDVHFGANVPARVVS